MLTKEQRMPNQLLKYEAQCPNCGEKRMVRSDVLARLQREGKPLICKPCHNRHRFDGRDHPRKGTGVKNDPVLARTQTSYYKAKQRCKMGAKHHACYAKVEFRFSSLQELIDCIGVRPEDQTLDRIDPLGHYEPGNVRWATVAQQTENRMPRGYWKRQN
jgi:predicted RNA-binding Zn-ribbon protein involved in translation (DUF1610 family)